MHAECRVTDRGVYVLSVAAKPMEAAWAKALRFHVNSTGAALGYEDVLLRHALGESPADWRRESDASGVMKLSAGCGYIYARAASADLVERELRQRAVVESRHG